MGESFWNIVPKSDVETTIADLHKLIDFRSKNPKIWRKISLLRLNIFDEFEFSSKFKYIVQIMFKDLSWNDFDRFLTDIYKTSFLKISNRDVLCYVAKVDAALNDKLRIELSKIFGDNVNISFKVKASILGGIVVEYGSMRIDTSYYRLLKNFIEANK